MEITDSNYFYVLEKIREHNNKRVKTLSELMIKGEVTLENVMAIYKRYPVIYIYNRNKRMDEYIKTKME